MTTSILGRAAVVCLVLAGTILGGVALWDPHGGHGVAGWVWLAFLLIALGLLLGLVRLLVWAFTGVRR